MPPPRAFAIVLAVFPLVATLGRAADTLMSVVDPAAFVRGGPPAFELGTGRLAFGTTVKVVEEKTADGKAYARVTEPVGDKALGWTLKTNLGSVKEFDPAMRVKTGVAVDALKGLELQMASTFNARGKYLHQKATDLGVKPADLAAVLHIESQGRGYDPRGRVIARFENHVFGDRWGRGHADAFAKHFRYNAQERWKGHEWRKTGAGEWAACHSSGQDGEWAVLEFAKTLDEKAALESASFGAAQIMGFNFKAVGYTSAAEMLTAFDGGIAAQLDAVVAFIKGKEDCIEGLKAADYTRFAKGYNGSGKAQEYGEKIKAASAAYAKVTKDAKVE